MVDAAARELREETGLELARGEVVRVVDGLGAARPYVTAIVRCEVAPGAEPRNAEPAAHVAVGWFGPDEVPERTWDRALLLELLQAA